MTILMVFPMRLLPTGRVVLADDRDEEYMAGELALLISTEPGERVLVPQYGVEDLVFDPTPIDTVAEKVELFGPPVSIENVTIEDVNDTECDITVEWTPLTDEDTDPDMTTDED